MGTPQEGGGLAKVAPCSYAAHPNSHTHAGEGTRHGIDENQLPPAERVV
jgi:hypothetical protein